jgi:hypothetical protein
MHCIVVRDSSLPPCPYTCLALNDGTRGEPHQRKKNRRMLETINATPPFEAVIQSGGCAAGFCASEESRIGSRQTHSVVEISALHCSSGFFTACTPHSEWRPFEAVIQSGGCAVGFCASEESRIGSRETHSVVEISALHCSSGFFTECTPHPE